MLSFASVFFVAGVLLGGTWTSLVPPTTAPHDKSLDDRSIATASETGLDPNNGASTKSGKNATPLSIAWLMTFPNSGTSYTGNMIRTVTGHNTATNYNKEDVSTEEQTLALTVPVLHDSKGPFWSSLSNASLTLPQSGYVLTKTHCGSRCNRCPISGYLEDHESFLYQCRRSHYIKQDGDGTFLETHDAYDQSLVSKAVHLIRDPYDNVVSRFHLSYRRFANKNHTERMKMYPKSREGFRSWCWDLGERFNKDEQGSRFYEHLDDVKDIPCHADFFRWIQWHNHALTTTWDMALPTLVMYYENYTTAFEETKNTLLDFLEQKQVHEPPPFVTGKTYRDYFTEDEVKAIVVMLRKLAMEGVWNLISHYFG